jgi:Fe(3+) dicitrate transport protein
MHSQIRSQQAGGLTDAQFGEDAQQSLRSRNWFDIRWTTAAIIANYKVSEKARWNTKLFAVHGDRNSVGFMQAITVKDSINAAPCNTITGQFRLTIIGTTGLKAVI